MAAATGASNIYQFKITLKDTHPKIWRRIQVPDTYSFLDLHGVIQDAMGWSDGHLHQFSMTKNRKRIIIGSQNEDSDDDTFGFLSDIIPEETAEIAKYFLSPKAKANYIYDMGDGWIHEILLENILPSVDGTKYPQCTAGERACPPEDCGGVSGYEYLLEILANPQHEEYADRKEWLAIDDDFDPEKFDPNSVTFLNVGLRNLFNF